MTLADVFSILRYVSLGSTLSCTAAADTDDNGEINQTDALYLLGSIFYRHGPLRPPFQSPGEDPTPDDTGCWKGLNTGGTGGDPEALGDDVSSGTDCEDEGGGPDLEFIHFRGGILVAPGETGIRVPVYLFSPAGGLEGFTLSFQAPPQWIRLDRVDFAGTLLAGLSARPEWMQEYRGQRAAGYLSASVAMSMGPPFSTLPEVPNPLLPNEVLAYLEFSVKPETPVGSRLEIKLEDTPGEKGMRPIQNEVSRKGSAQPKHLCGLAVHVVSARDLFVRGDVTRDRDLNLSDMILILRYLFAADLGGTLPCADAADVDDNGRVRLSDAIAIANYLFRRGDVPAQPFPGAGRDPTPDDLGCEADK